MRRSGLLVLALLALAPAFAGWSVPRSEAASEEAPAHRLEQMTVEQFRALPDAAIVEAGGKRLAKGQYIAAMEAKARELFAQQSALAAIEMGKALEEARTKLLGETRRRIEANNAGMLTEFSARTRSAAAAKLLRFESIRAEARRLQAAALRADAAEQERLQKRAAALVAELKGLGFESGGPRIREPVLHRELLPR